MNVDDIQTIGVIGAGTMGGGIAQVCAATGYHVRLIDVDAAALDRALASIRGSVEKLHGKGKLSDAQRDAALSGIATGLDLAEASDAQLVIEAVSEALPLKQTISAAGRADRAGRDPRQQYLLDLDHRDRGGDAAARAGHRPALHEPRPADAAGRGDSRAGDQPGHARRDDGL